MTISDWDDSHGHFHIFFQDAETIEKMNECGELRQILRPFKVRICKQNFDIFKNLCFFRFQNVNAVTSICGKCGGFRMLPCPICAGSKKSMHRNDFTEQFIALRCTTCDECGLVKCDECWWIILWNVSNKECPSNILDRIFISEYGNGGSEDLRRI